jgi:hypothetical protein
LGVICERRSRLAAWLHTITVSRHNKRRRDGGLSGALYFYLAWPELTLPAKIGASH